MIAVDTNILTRFLVEDDEKIQHQKAVKLFLSYSIYISKTVFLETEWVLRANFKLPRGVILDSFQKLLLLNHLHFEDKEAILMALTYFEKGMDFADALHLASAPSHTTFMSFDKKLIQRAKQVHQKAGLL